ncbi:30S ribosomal protein S20 [Microscilla marina]|uniref:Small ribosomal subunit protein bS20 n=1 Tax=Microscilla marina ATCC 23134 TaxID=313606 RepID=A1ZJH1_MICM2|nr:30S ribosomal protein S20 [Microscilla marina]EAY29274.1 ribosomal protein S20 [Microscilla marina ATCC 23134]
MANHKSALKRIRANEKKRLRNRYQVKQLRATLKQLNATKEKSEAETLLKTASSQLDKLARKNVIHKNKAANQKSKLTKQVSALG